MQQAPAAAGTGVVPLLAPEFEQAVQAAVDGYATPEQLARLETDRWAWQVTLERMLDETEEHLDSVRTLPEEIRDQVVADFEGERDRLVVAIQQLTGRRPDGTEAPELEAPGEVRLQASWSAGRLVVWAAGPTATPATRDEIAERLAAAGAPTTGWSAHQSAPLPEGDRAPTQAIHIGQALGWLAAVGAAPAHGQTADTALPGGDSLGASVRWMGRVAAWGVHLTSQGAIVPLLKRRNRSRARRTQESGVSDYVVRWVPATVDQARLDAFAATMPGPVGVFDQADAASVTLAVLGAVVDAIATDAAGRLEMPAPPPAPRTPTSVAEAFLTRLDGSSFEAPSRMGSDLARKLDRWARAVVGPAGQRLVVQLDPPDDGGAWFLSVLGPDAEGVLVPVEVALVDKGSKAQIADELARLEHLLPVLLRPGGLRRGQVYLDQAEAWELMTETGATLEAAGFEVRVPALSRRKPAPSLRMLAEASDPSVVGANQLADVRWSAVFDDVELTASDIAALAAQARPLVRSRGRWVQLDQADLKEAAAALAEQASNTQLTGAEVLRYAVGLEGSSLRGGITVDGSGWAAELLTRASEAPSEPVTSPEGFEGELRSYQADALAWLGFLDAVELGGILALDMGLGKTPTVLAHIARTAGEGPALVIAPPAVVGNWAAEAARFTPGVRVVVHHGASRASARELEREVAGADLVITTYGTAVRDVEALAAQPWRRMVLDEAQAVKNPASETAQQLRRIPARIRLALTGTPIENGLGDLWALLDFTNPGLVGSRPAFVSQLSANGNGKGGGGTGEKALRALNGVLVFRRTKSEPVVAAELPERIDQLDHCTMTPEQIGLYQAVLDRLVTAAPQSEGEEPRQAEILAAITALKQICNHPAAYQDDGEPLAGRSGKLARLEEIVDAVFEAGERILVFTHFAEWGKRLATHLSAHTGVPVACYHGGLARGARDRLVKEFQEGEGPGALVLSLKAGGTGLNLTAASHVVLYDRWWNPAVEDQARDRAWRIGQTRTVVSHRLVCPGTVDERVEEVVSGKRRIADLVLPRSSSLADLDSNQLRTALGLRPDEVLTEDAPAPDGAGAGAGAGEHLEVVP